MNTKFLTLLAAILIYYTIVPDIESANEKLVRDIKIVEYKIASEANTTGILKKTQQLAKKDIAVDSANRALFIDQDIPDALAFSALQKAIRSDVNESKGELTNLSWGEPSTKDESPYTLLPLSISYKGSPQSCTKFLTLFHQHKILLYIESLSIVQYQDNLLITADIYAYRFANKKQAKERQ